ncbi:SanA/YdcF family protein [Demequina lignilytica]|uniref:YdcF family protein n=1 Tax=Demequina lignilytica TaxID=3051663 RepID=A0AB35MGZ6_9MICO|nr:YdcF family protein [Demequina sp. SYSU T0a273]MDN4483007.1 YdcF family protein [Demequina sp. SYSU T0a273]
MSRPLVALGAAGLAAVAAPAVAMRASTASSRHAVNSGELRPADAALVLGARVWPDGRPSRFLRERVAVGVELYRRGLVGTLLMSGAGPNREGLDEPGAMRRTAIEMGVPARDIVMDPAGVNTWASARGAAARDLRSVIACSQEFHLPRAVWLCRRAGLEAQGASPAVLARTHTVIGYGREMAAAWKAVLDTMA